MNITEPWFDEHEMDALRECLDSKWVTQGPMTDKFESLVRERHSALHAMACTSCTSALHLATLALELKPGDEVIVPAFTWVTSAYSAEYVGAKVVFADIDLATFNIDPEAFEKAITPRTKAVVAVHLFGLAAPMDEILEIAGRHGIAVIEDAACAIGTTYKGNPVGALGDIGCFSFHPRKLVTTGEGGMVLTNSEELATAVRSLRNHGSTGLPSDAEEAHGPWTMATFDRVGLNLRLSDIQAAVGVAQMGKLGTLLADRRASASRYTAMLREAKDLSLPDAGNADGHTYQSYVVRVREGGRRRRNKIMQGLADNKIQTRPGTHAVHRLGFYREKYGFKQSDFPNAALAEDTTITLPIFPKMRDSDNRLVADLVLGLLAETAAEC